MTDTIDIALDISPEWNTPNGHPNGGYLLREMLRGIERALDVGTPLVAAVTYLAPPAFGAATLHLECLKRGRTVQSLAGVVRQGDKPVLHLTVSYAQRTESETKLFATPPDLPPVAECVDARDGGLPEIGIFQHVRYRLPAAPGWAVGEPTGDPTSQLWQKPAEGPTDFPTLGLLVDSFAPPVLELGHNSATVQLTVHFHALPQSDWVATKLTTRHVAGGFHEEDAELWDEHGTLVAQSRQMAIVLP